MFENGLLNLTNWAGNVIMPTLAGLFFAAAIYQLQQGPSLLASRLGRLCVTDVLRTVEGAGGICATGRRNRSGPLLDSILTLVNWVGNVMLPLYGVIQVVMMVLHSAGLLERMTIGEAWVRNLVVGHDVLRPVGTVAAGRVLDPERHGGSEVESYGSRCNTSQSQPAHASDLYGT